MKTVQETLAEIDRCLQIANKEIIASDEAIENSRWWRPTAAMDAYHRALNGRRHKFVLEYLKQWILLPGGRDEP